MSQRLPLLASAVTRRPQAERVNGGRRREVSVPTARRGRALLLRQPDGSVTWRRGVGVRRVLQGISLGHGYDPFSRRWSVVEVLVGSPVAQLQPLPRPPASAPAPALTLASSLSSNPSSSPYHSLQPQLQPQLKPLRQRSMALLGSAPTAGPHPSRDLFVPTDQSRDSVIGGSPSACHQLGSGSWRTELSTVGGGDRSCPLWVEEHLAVHYGWRIGAVHCGWRNTELSIMGGGSELSTLGGGTQSCPLWSRWRYHVARIVMMSHMIQFSPVGTIRYQPTDCYCKLRSLRKGQL
ncbi:unnamed protein product [Lota lota]